MCQNGCCRKILNALGQELLNNWGQTKKIHIKKADKGTTTVIMNKKDEKYKRAKFHSMTEKNYNYMPLGTPMVEETSWKSKR